MFSDIFLVRHTCRAKNSERLTKEMEAFFDSAVKKLGSPADATALQRLQDDVDKKLHEARSNK